METWNTLRKMQFLFNKNAQANFYSLEIISNTNVLNDSRTKREICNSFSDHYRLMNFTYT